MKELSKNELNSIHGGGWIRDLVSGTLCAIEGFFSTPHASVLYMESINKP